MHEKDVYFYRDRCFLHFNGNGVKFVQYYQELPSDALILTDSVYIEVADELRMLFAKHIIWTTTPAIYARQNGQKVIEKMGYRNIPVDYEAFVMRYKGYVEWLHRQTY